jgi:hypothetical protein
MHHGRLLLEFHLVCAWPKKGEWDIVLCFSGFVMINFDWNCNL